MNDMNHKKLGGVNIVLATGCFVAPARTNLSANDWKPAPSNLLSNHEDSR